MPHHLQAHPETPTTSPSLLVDTHGWVACQGSSQAACDQVGRCLSKSKVLVWAEEPGEQVLEPGPPGLEAPLCLLLETWQDPALLSLAQAPEGAQ